MDAVVMVVIACVVALAIFSFVKTGRESRRADETLEQTSRSLGLSAADDRSWRGSVDGLDVMVWPSMRDLAKHADVELFSFSPTGDANSQRGLERHTAIAVRVPGAPSALAFGAKQPLIRGVQALGDEEFDRLFAVRAAPPEVIAFLDQRRRSVLIERPVTWFADGWWITRIGHPDPDTQLGSARRFIADAASLT